MDELFEQRRRRRVAGALPRTANLPFDEQVAALTAILDEDGYLADAERLDDGSWRITEHNCAILTVAHGFSQACSSELAFIRDALPGATVRRVAHLMDGAHVCAYVVSPPESSNPPPDLEDGDPVHLVDLVLQQLDQVVPADLDDELVDRAALVALEDVDGDDVTADRPDPAGHQAEGTRPVGQRDPDDVASHGQNVTRSM